MDLSILSALLLSQLAAPTPTCAPGLVLVDGSQHCCLPGQRWSDEAAGCVGAPLPQAPQPVPVRLSAARDGDWFMVEVDRGEHGVCQTPCELHLLPSRYRLRVSGPVEFGSRLDVLNEPLDLRIERHEDSWRKLGIASVVAGGALAVAGLGVAEVYFVLMSIRSMGDPPTGWSADRNVFLACGGVVALGAVVAVTGALVGFGKAGHDRIRPAAESSARRDKTVELVAVGAGPADHGGQVAATFSF